MPIPDDLSFRLQSAIERSRRLRRHSQLLSQMVLILKSSSADIRVEAKACLSALSRQLSQLTLSKKAQMTDAHGIGQKHVSCCNRHQVSGATRRGEEGCSGGGGRLRHLSPPWGSS
jgi:hypothetical protein